MILATPHSQISETKHLDVTIIKDDRSWRTPVTLTLASWASGQSDPKFQHFAFKSRLGSISIFYFLNHKSVLEGSKAIGPININMYEMLKEEKRGRFQNLKFGSCFCFLQSTSKAQLICSFFLFVSSPFTFLLRFCLLADLSRKRRWRHRRTSGGPSQPGDRPVRPDDHLPLAHVRGQRHQPAQDPQSRDRTVPVRRSRRAGQDPIRGG